jgi:membrane protein
MSESDSVPPAPKKPSLIARVVAMIREDAWSTASLGDKSLRGRFYAAVRVIGITVKGIVLNKIPLNAAALTYYTLMSLGPMLALALTVSSGILQKQENGHALAKAKVAELIQMVAPQTASAGKPKEAHPESGDKPAPAGETKPAATETIGEPKAEPTKEEKTAATLAKADELNSINPELSKMVDRLLEKSASGGAGAVGTIILIVLAVLMLTRVETAFNSIWGVTKGRPWKDRFVNYVLFMILGCVLGAASLTMLSVGAAAKALGDKVPQWVFKIPGGTTLLDFFQGVGPTVISVGLLTCLVAVLIRVMPYTRVHWKAAFGGGLFVAIALALNQKAGALYAGKVSQLGDLYGSMSIILVLMFGMYLSWLLLLIGCQVTFAVQYVHRLAAYRTWENLSARTRETLCFGCLVLIARRFRNMEIAADSEEMAAALHVPRSLTDESIKKLLSLKLIVAIDDGDDKPENDRYRPDFPLNALTVGKIRERLQTQNGVTSVDPSFNFDAGVTRFTEAFGHFDELEQSKQSFDNLLAETEAKAN